MGIDMPSAKCAETDVESIVNKQTKHSTSRFHPKRARNMINENRFENKDIPGAKRNCNDVERMHTSSHVDHPKRARNVMNESGCEITYIPNAKHVRTDGERIVNEPASLACSKYSDCEHIR